MQYQPGSKVLLAVILVTNLQGTLENKNNQCLHWISIVVGVAGDFYVCVLDLEAKCPRIFIQAHTGGESSILR